MLGYGMDLQEIGRRETDNNFINEVLRVLLG